MPCSACGATPTRLMICARCKTARYCNRACQKEHWRAGHKMECTPPSSEPPPLPPPAPPVLSGTLSGTEADTASGAAPPLTCAICHDTYSPSGDARLAHSPCGCAAVFHNECFREHMHKSPPKSAPKCPVCRAWIGIGDRVSISIEDVPCIRQQLLDIAAGMPSSSRTDMIRAYYASCSDAEILSQWSQMLAREAPEDDDTPFCDEAPESIAVRALGFAMQARTAAEGGEEATLRAESTFVKERLALAHRAGARDRAYDLMRRANAQLTTAEGIPRRAYASMFMEAVLLLLVPREDEESARASWIPHVSCWMRTLSPLNTSAPGPHARAE